MLDLCSLQSLYLSQEEESSCFLDEMVYQFFTNGITPPKELVEDCVWQSSLLGEDKSISNWRELLTVNILCLLSKVHQSELASKVQFFNGYPWNQTSQYARAFVAINHAFAKMPIPEVGTHLLDNGAALIDLHEYCPWLSLPYSPYHCEFGTFLSLLALMTERIDFQESALNLAYWQLNTLDCEGIPFAGLFVRETEGTPLPRLCLSYLLFQSASRLTKDSPFNAIAERLLKKIEEHIKKTKEKIDPLWMLIEKWLEKYPIQSQEPLELPENIYDPSTALIGYRSSSGHVLCTLHGAGTGLGTFRLGEDIEIISYGPQYLPLAECKGFGIEGNALSDQGIRRSIIEWRRHSFLMKGCTRLVDQPAESSLGLGIFRGIWLEVSQEYMKPNLHLKTSFLAFEETESIAFNFFVKASSCVIDGKILKPKTLERYEGEVCTIVLQGKESALELRNLVCSKTMQVIPLAGENHFWGADFLIAYILSPGQKDYEWHIGPGTQNGNNLTGKT